MRTIHGRNKRETGAETSEKENATVNTEHTVYAEELVRNVSTTRRGILAVVRPLSLEHALRQRLALKCSMAICMRLMWPMSHAVPNIPCLLIAHNKVIPKMNNMFCREFRLY